MIVIMLTTPELTTFQMTPEAATRVLKAITKAICYTPLADAKRLSVPFLSKRVPISPPGVPEIVPSREMKSSDCGADNDDNEVNSDSYMGPHISQNQHDIQCIIENQLIDMQPNNDNKNDDVSLQTQSITMSISTIDPIHDLGAVYENPTLAIHRYTAVVVN